MYRRHLFAAQGVLCLCRFHLMRAFWRGGCTENICLQLRECCACAGFTL